MAHLVLGKHGWAGIVERRQHSCFLLPSYVFSPCVGQSADVPQPIDRGMLALNPSSASTIWISFGMRETHAAGKGRPMKGSVAVAAMFAVSNINCGSSQDP